MNFAEARFGNIISVYAISDITKGEEIIGDYGYGRIVGRHMDKWVSELYLKETGKHWYGVKQEK